MNAAGIARLLPSIFQRALEDSARLERDPLDSPLHSALAVMERFHAPCEAVLGDLDRYFDPRRAPDALVHFLARWVDLDRLCSASEPGEGDERGGAPCPPELGRLRGLIALAPRLAQRRGTRAGLLQMLEVATGVRGFRVEDVRGDDGRVVPFRVRVVIPAAAAPQAALVRRIVEQEKPAYVTEEFGVEPQ